VAHGALDPLLVHLLELVRLVAARVVLGHVGDASDRAISSATSSFRTANSKSVSAARKASHRVQPSNS
jgi:hypothetical protein